MINIADYFLRAILSRLPYVYGWVGGGWDFPSGNNATLFNFLVHLVQTDMTMIRVIKGVLVIRDCEGRWSVFFFQECILFLWG